MGALDTVGKQYFSDRTRFADAFNYLIYDGEPVIRAEELKELDTAQIVIPYGNQAFLPLQKYRDLLKIWEAKMDDSMIYVMLGGELQGKVHYGMPVKNLLYDAIGYAKQIEEAKRSYRGKVSGTKNEIKRAKENGSLYIEDGTLKVRLSSEEFLSGFRKEDKLIPIVTAVIYVGAKPWDGPKSLYDMMDLKDERIRRLVPDYWINLISPADMEEADIGKFQSDLSFCMKVLKHQGADADKIIEATDHRMIGADTARFLNVAANLRLEFEGRGGEVDMSTAIERRYQKEQITGAITGMRAMGASDPDIIEKVMELYHVTKEYVLALLAPKTT